MSSICFDRTFIVFALVIVSIIAIYNYNKNAHHPLQCPSAQCPQHANNNQPTILRPNIKVNIHQNDIDRIGPAIVGPVGPPRDIIRDYDYRVVDDILTGPAKRPPRDVIGPIVTNPLFNIYTQGPPDSFSWVGLLITTDVTPTDPKNKILKLFGRQKYPNSNNWDYYVTAYAGGDDTVKISLHKHIYKKELYDDDAVTISELGMNYKVKLNRDDFMSYNPYLL